MCIEVGRALAWAILNPFLIGEPLRVSSFLSVCETFFLDLMME